MDPEHLEAPLPAASEAQEIRDVKQAYLPEAWSAEPEVFRQSCPDNDPEQDTFCPYSTTNERCNISIYDELAVYDAHPLGVFSAVDLLTTYEGRKIRALRIGNLTGSIPFTRPSPQVVVVAAVHGNEVLTTEVAMRVLRYFVEAIETDADGVSELLRDRTLTILPVANPDGYDHTIFGGGVEDGQGQGRKNRRTCHPSELPFGPPGRGVDINRNFPLTWESPPWSDVDCGSATYRGREHPTIPGTPIAEPEHLALRILAGHDESVLDGRYETAFLVDVHTQGNVAMFHGALGLGQDFSPCGLNGNCTAPDHGVMNAILGTENPDRAVLHDPYTGLPVPVGTQDRLFAISSGSLISEAKYGDMFGASPNMLATTLELTFGCPRPSIPPEQIDELAEDMIELVRRALEAAPDLLANTYTDSRVGKFALVHVHRSEVTHEFPVIRFAVRKTIPEAELATDVPGSADPDPYLDGVLYRSWSWKPEKPFVFPPVFQICAERDCEEFGIDEGSINLCDDASWVQEGWEFTGLIDDSSPQDQCFWEVDPTHHSWRLQRQADLTNIRNARLVYSIRYRRMSSGEYLRVLISDNGFQNCAWHTGTGCRVVRQYPYRAGGGSSGDSRQGYNTEILDISDFDGESVSVRFEGTGLGSQVEPMQIYDVVLQGRRVQQ